MWNYFPFQFYVIKRIEPVAMFNFIVKHVWTIGWSDVTLENQFNCCFEVHLDL